MKIYKSISLVFCLLLVSCSHAPIPVQTATENKTLLACPNTAGFRPDQSQPAGQANMKIPIEHILVIMQENHSFDSYLGSLALHSKNVNGISPELFNLDKNQKRVPVYHETNLCVADVDHTWNGMHKSWNNGLNDQFVVLNDTRTMGYYTEKELPFYYELAKKFAISDTYFASAMTQTNPNRYFLLAATAFGEVANVDPPNDDQYSQKTIFDTLTDHGISWTYYTDSPGYLQYFRPLVRRSLAHMKKMIDYQNDLKNGHLPQVAFIDAAWDVEDEHPAANIQLGQLWVAQRVTQLIHSQYWKNSALFLTYDESGDYYDHVSPPAACKPDDIEPRLKPKHVPGSYDRYGFRVPFFAVSAYAKENYVSHMIYDHTSILKFIETKFNLPALTRRDANANDLLDVFDFKHPPRKAVSLKMPVIESQTGCPVNPAQ